MRLIMSAVAGLAGVDILGNSKAQVIIGARPADAGSALRHSARGAGPRAHDGDLLSLVAMAEPGGATARRMLVVGVPAILAQMAAATQQIIEAEPVRLAGADRLRLLWSAG